MLQLPRPAVAVFLDVAVGMLVLPITIQTFAPMAFVPFYDKQQYEKE